MARFAQPAEDQEAEFNDALVGLFRLRIADGRLLECNNLFARFLGYANREECLVQYVASERYVDPKVHEELLRQLRESGAVRNFDAQVKRKDGSPLWVSYSARIASDRDSVDVAAMDISERKQADEAKEQVHEMLQDQLDVIRRLQDTIGLLAGGVAHELNNRLASILGNADLALLALPSDSGARKLIQKIESGTLKAAQVTEQMLALASEDEPDALDNLVEKLAEGASLSALFPTTEQPVERQAEKSSETEDWRGSGTILVVDDEEDVRHIARRLLEKLGFTVMEAKDGHEGLQTFREHGEEIEAVLLDMVMPGMDGKTVFQEIRGLNPDARIILMSGYNVEHAVNRVEMAGPTGFIQKPFRMQQLADQVREVLEEKPETQ